MACFSIRLSATWLTHAARHVAREWGNARIAAFDLRTLFGVACLRKSWLAKRLGANSHKRGSSPSCSHSSAHRKRYICVVRFTLMTWIASPLSWKKALIGVRAICGQQFLSAKLKTRKNLTSGCIYAAPVFATWLRPRRRSCAQYIFFGQKYATAWARGSCFFSRSPGGTSTGP